MDTKRWWRSKFITEGSVLVALAAPCCMLIACARAHDARTPKGMPAPPGQIVRSQAARPPAPWPGPAGDFIFLEGEALELTGSGWEIDPSTGGNRDRDESSGDKVLAGAPAGAGTATTHFTVPAAGEYRLWVRASRPEEGAPKGNSFLVSVGQGGADKAEWTVDPQGLPPTPVQARFEPGTPERRAADRKESALHEAFSWESTAVDLDAGAATLTVSKVGPTSQEASRLRRIDCFLLTTDASYHPNHRDFSQQRYVRFRVAHSDQPLSFRATRAWIATSPLTAPIPANGSSPWLNVTRVLSRTVRTVYPIDTVGIVQRANYRVEIADAPNDSSILQAIEHSGPSSELRVVFPPASEATAAPKAAKEFAKARADLVALLPRITFGKRPRSYPVLTDLPDVAELRTAEYPAMEYLGINGFTGVLDARDMASGMIASRLYRSIYFTGPEGHLDANWDATRKELTRIADQVRQSSTGDRIKHLKVIDEAHPKKLEQLEQSEAAQKAFRVWLSAHRYDPFSADEKQKLVASHGLDEKTRLTSDRKTAFPGLFYYSERFRASTIVDFFKQETTLAHEILPGIPTTQNFSDGVVLYGSFFGQGNDYFDYFSRDALDVAMSEDWTNGSTTHELAGWNVALLRAATREHHQPIHMYLITYSDRRPLEIKLRALTSISEGAKLLNVYRYGPSYVSPQDIGWSETPLLFPVIAELTHEIGAAEDDLVDAEPFPASVAILYSIPADVWTNKDDSAHSFDRMGTYLALRHAQVPVDVLSDDQARTPLLKGYRTLFFASEQLDKRDVAPLRDWVYEGGTLVLSAGAGTRDEWNRPSDALARALAVQFPPAQNLQHLFAGTKQYCTGAKVMGTVSPQSDTAHEGSFASILGWRSDLHALDGDTLATLSEDHAPAAIRVRRGRGQVVLEGFLPGLAYLCDGFRSWDKDATELIAPMRVVRAARDVLDHDAAAREPRMPRALHDGPLPYRYSDALRRYLVSFATGPGTARPVVVSVPQIEATLLTGKKGWVVPLANYTGAPLTEITVTIRSGRSQGAVSSSHMGVLRTTAVAGGVQVSLPLESTDFIFADWQ